MMKNKNHQTHRQRLEQREDSIIMAAHEEFMENGLEGAKMADIAKRVGVAEGTLYLYFKNKNALLSAVVGAFYARLTERAATGVEDCATTSERLAFLARHHLESCLREWSILALAVPVFYRAGEYRDSEFIGFNRAYVAVFDGVIREGIARGNLRDDLPLHMMRDLFYGTLEHSVRTHMVHRQDLQDDPGITLAVEQVMAMVHPAFGLSVEDTQVQGETEIESIAQRLESLEARLEAVSRQS